MPYMDPISDDLRQSLLEEYPYLTPQVPEGKSLVAKNMRAMVKHLYPEWKVRGQLSVYAGGSSVHLSAVDFEREPEERYRVSREILVPLADFAYGDFDGMTDSYHSNTDSKKQAFRSLFGGTSYVFIEVRGPTVEEKDEWLLKQAKALSKTIPKTSKKTKGPGRI